MNRIKPFMLFLFAIIRCSQNHAQDLSAFKKVEGLNSKVVYCVMQDSKGYIWMGTGSGAVRYDGSAFVYLTTDDGLTDNDVFQIKEDAKGRLWFLNNSGKPCIYDHGKVLNLNNAPWLEAIQPQKLSIHWSEQGDGSVWYASLDTAYRIVNDRVVEKQALDKSMSILRVFSFKGTSYLMGTSGVYNTASKKVQYFEEGKTIASQHSQTYQYKNLLYYFTDDRLLYYDLLTKENKELLHFPNKEWGVMFIPTKHPDSLIVSTPKHLYTLNMANKSCIANELVLPAPFLTGMLTDKEGNQWCSSLSDGLLLKKVQKPIITQVMQHPLLPDSLSCNTLSKMGGRIFIGYDKGYYLQIQGKDPSVHRFAGFGNLYRSTLVFQFTGQTLWCAATSKIIKKEKTREAEFPVSAKSIAAVKEGLYMATSEGVLFLNKAHYNNWSNAVFQKNIVKLSTQRANRLLVKTQDTLFATGIHGMQMFVQQQKALLPWNAPILNAHITKAVLAENGTILVSTKNKGIALLTTDSVYVITKANGLLSNSCNSIYCSGKNICWIATAKGINRLEFTLQKDKRLTYQVSEPSINEELGGTNVHDVLQTNDTLLVATDKGLYLHQLMEHKKHPFYPPLYIESVKVNDSVYHWPQELLLQHGQNRIQIAFTGIAFQVNGHVKFRYRLLPIDSNWHYTSSHFVDYPFLPAGNYTFSLSASVAGYDWSPQLVSVQLHIENPFWKKWWFLMLIGALIVAGIALAVGMVIRHLKKKHAIDKQISELENKALRLQMNPHFIFNAINAIKGYYASGNVQDAKTYIDTFSSLMRLMLDTASDSHIQLSNELSLIDGYLKLCSFRYNQQFTFSIDCNTQTPIEQLYIPVMLIQPFVENAVQHGVASLKKGGHIAVVLQQQGPQLTCTIEDNGVGRKKAQELGRHKIHVSKSIEITEQRLALLGLNNGLKMIDKTDATGGSLGTLVQLTIPLYDSNLA